MSNKAQQLKAAMQKSEEGKTTSLSKEEQEDLKSAFVSPKQAKKKQTLFRLYEDEIQALDKVVEMMQPELRDKFSRNTAIRIAISLLAKQKPEKIKAILKKIRVE